MRAAIAGVGWGIGECIGSEKSKLLHSFCLLWSANTDLVTYANIVIAGGGDDVYGNGFKAIGFALCFVIVWLKSYEPDFMYSPLPCCRETSENIILF